MVAHSDHVAYRNWDEADVWLDPLGRKSSFRLFLDGSWKFHYARNYEQTIHGFEKPEYDCRGWDDIRVPAHIQMEGYDSPQYANTQYPWDGREDIHHLAIASWQVSKMSSQASSNGSPEELTQHLFFIGAITYYLLLRSEKN